MLVLRLCQGCSHEQAVMVWIAALLGMSVDTLGMRYFSIALNLNEPLRYSCCSSSCGSTAFETMAGVLLMAILGILQQVSNRCCQMLPIKWRKFATLKHRFINMKWCGCLSIEPEGSNRTSGCTNSMDRDNLSTTE